MCVGERMKECKSEREDQSVHLGDRERECVHFCDGKEKQEITSKIEREREQERICVCMRACILKGEWQLPALSAISH